MGKVVGRVRVACRPRLRFLRNRSRAQAAREGLRSGDIEPQPLGLLRKLRAAAAIRSGAPIPGCGRALEERGRTITTHTFGLWAVDAGKPEVGLFERSVPVPNTYL